MEGLIGKEVKIILLRMQTAPGPAKANTPVKERSHAVTNELQGQRRVNASWSRINSRESWRTAADAPKKLKISKKIIHRCIIADFPVTFCLLSSTFSLPTVFSSTAPSLHIFLELCPNSSLMNGAVTVMALCFKPALSGCWD